MTTSVSEKILEQVRVIPPLSRTATELIGVLERDMHTLDDVVSVVSSDPMLVGQLLKIANCAAFARRNPVDSIGGAVSYLGDKMIIGIALGASAARIYDAPLKGYDAESGSLWQHSLRTAIAARELAKYTEGKVNAGVAYTAGLLHDIGKALLSIHLEDRIKDIFTEMDSHKCDFLSAEKAVAGANHCEVGMMLAKHWNLPKNLRASIADHHQPSTADEDSRGLAYVVHIADMVAMMAGVGTGADTMGYSFDTNYSEYITIKREELDRLLLVVGMEFGKVESAMGEIA